MRRYEDPVEVRRGAAEDRGGPGPAQFLWRGRLWKVRSVLAHWVETGPWWQGATDEGPDPAVDLLAERELWRVEAARGGPHLEAADVGGVFDLAYDGAEGRWQLVGCLD